MKKLTFIILTMLSFSLNAMSINNQEVTDPVVQELIEKQMYIIKQIVLFNIPQAHIKNAFYQHFNGNIQTISAKLFNGQIINIPPGNIPDNLHQQFKDTHEEIKIHVLPQE